MMFVVVVVDDVCCLLLLNGKVFFLSCGLIKIFRFDDNKNRRNEHFLVGDIEFCAVVFFVCLTCKHLDMYLNIPILNVFANRIYSGYYICTYSVVVL